MRVERTNTDSRNSGAKMIKLESLHTCKILTSPVSFQFCSTASSPVASTFVHTQIGVTGCQAQPSLTSVTERNDLNCMANSNNNFINISNSNTVSRKAQLGTVFLLKVIDGGMKRLQKSYIFEIRTKQTGLLWLAVLLFNLSKTGQFPKI